MATNIDILNRQPFVDRLIQIVRYLADNHRGCTFAIDGQWGSGKSYVLDMFEKQMSLFQSPEAAGDRYILFHYNCWQYDFYEEPAIAIVAAMRDEILKYQKLFPNPPIEIKAALSLVSDLGKDLIENIVESKLGFSPFKTLESYKAKKESHEKEEADANGFDTFFDFKIALDKTRDKLNNVAEEKPIVVVVDELDRCMPEYAIKVLERLHHLFDNQENVIVVLAVDGKQLRATVENIYGISGKAKVARYLRKFISFTIHLDKGRLSDGFLKKYQTLLEKFEKPSDGYQGLVQFAETVFSGIDARAQEKIMDHIMVLHNLSFNGVAGIYILYFELMSQVLSYLSIRDHLIGWLLKPPIEASIREKYGNRAYTLYLYFHESANYWAGPSSFIEQIIEDPVCISFWIFDIVVSEASQTPFDNCFFLNRNQKSKDIYTSLGNSSKYIEELSAAYKFYELSKLISLNDFNSGR